MYSFFKDLSPEETSAILSTLSEREAKVISLRLGIDSGKPRTYEEVGKMFNVTPERIRQIEAKAIRKILHPSRTKFLNEYREGIKAKLEKNTLKKNTEEVDSNTNFPNPSLIENSSNNQADQVKREIGISQEDVAKRIEKLSEALHNQGMPYQEIKSLLLLSPQQLENIRAMTSIEELLKYTKMMNPFQYLAGKADTKDVIIALERIAYGTVPHDENIIDDAVKTAMQKLEAKQAIETKQKQKPFVIIGLIVLFALAFTIHPGFLALIFLVVLWFVALWASGEYHI